MNKLLTIVAAVILIVGIPGGRISGRPVAAPCCNLGVTRKTQNTEAIVKTKGETVEVEYALKNNCQQSLYVRISSETNSYPVVSTAPPLLAPLYIQIKNGRGSDTVNVKVRFTMPACVDGKMLTFRMKFLVWTSVPQTGRSATLPCSSSTVSFDVTCKSCVSPKWQDIKDVWPACASPGQALTDTWKFENVSAEACAGIVYTFTNLDEPETIRAEFPKVLTVANQNEPKEIKIMMSTGNGEPPNNTFKWAWRCDGFNSSTGDLCSTFTVRKSIPACAAFELTKKPEKQTECGFGKDSLPWEFINLSPGDIDVSANAKTEGLELAISPKTVKSGQTFKINTVFDTSGSSPNVTKHAFTVKATNSVGFFEKTYDFEVSLCRPILNASQLITFPVKVKLGWLKYIIYKLDNASPKGSKSVYLSIDGNYQSSPSGGKIDNITLIGANPLPPGQSATLIMTASLPFGGFKGFDYLFKFKVFMKGNSFIPLQFYVKSEPF